ncbi:MAG: hypothetical protein NZ908_00290 [Candidatus Micrarchaeota archaeon]|nr:hypothetical protein [Candidatus Micrarchaeota archaeon]MCX8154649.1 hypothetical protein [Candidatus Micrarchaeota archaeon]
MCNDIKNNFEYNLKHIREGDILLAQRLARDGQRPCRVIITCSDSRIPEEMFKREFLGENFVIRNAGNALDDYGIDTLTFAVNHLKIQEICIIAHTGCGAVRVYSQGLMHEFPHIYNLISQNIHRARDIQDLEIANAVGLARRLKERFSNVNIKVYLYDIERLELRNIEIIGSLPSPYRQLSHHQETL